jgi:hypothetical protein
MLLSSPILVVVSEVLDTTPPKILSTYPYDGLTVGINDFSEVNAYVQEVEGSLTSIRYYDSFVPYGIELLPVLSVAEHSMWIPDINKDGRVDDADAYEVMLILGSKSGDTNWNPDADVNGDEIINVLDLIVVRMWYGTGTYAAIHPNPSVGTVDFTFIAEDETGNQTIITGTFTITGPLPVGGHASPIDKSHFLATKIGLALGMGLASVLLAAMAVTIILIRRRNKTLKWGR